MSIWQSGRETGYLIWGFLTNDTNEQAASRALSRNNRGELVQSQDSCCSCFQCFNLICRFFYPAFRGLSFVLRVWLISRCQTLCPALEHSMLKALKGCSKKSSIPSPTNWSKDNLQMKYQTCILISNSQWSQSWIIIKWSREQVAASQVLLGVRSPAPTCRGVPEHVFCLVCKSVVFWCVSWLLWDWHQTVWFFLKTEILE